MNDRGYSLIEVMIAVGLSSFLLFIAMSQSVSMTQTQFQYISRSNLAQDALTITNYFGHEFGEIGGASVRPWMSAYLENNCALRGPFPDCDGSDRLTLTSSVIPAQECFVTANPSSNVLTVAMSAGVCCLNPAMLNQNFMITQGLFYSEVFASSIDTLACSMTFAPGQASPNDALPPSPVDWSGGTITMVTVKTIYWDSSLKQVKQYSDFNNNAQIDPGEMNILADQVLDIQFSLGLDINGDSNLIDTASNTDNYLFNSPGENWGVGTFLNANINELKILEVALITGTPISYGGVPLAKTLQILDGPVRDLSKWDSRKAILKFAPRNDFLYH